MEGFVLFVHVERTGVTDKDFIVKSEGFFIFSDVSCPGSFEKIPVPQIGCLSALCRLLIVNWFGRMKTAMYKSPVLVIQKIIGS
jgi:hypothetical protein